MHICIKRRTFIRILCFGAALVLVLAVGWGLSVQHAGYYSHALEYSYVSAINDLSSSLSNISFALQKLTVTSTPQQLSTLSANLWRETGFAKQRLATLPLGELNLENTFRFLSQAGDYAISIAKKADETGEISDEEAQTLTQLHEYSLTLCQQLEDLQTDIDAGAVSLSSVMRAFYNELGADASASAADLGFSEIEQGFEGFPTLIYDGPFSDHMQNLPVKMLENAEEIPWEQARQTAALALSCQVSDILSQGEENSSMPAYVFSTQNASVSVTKQGGYVTYLLAQETQNGRNLSVEQAISQAQQFLQALGYANMEENYYEIKNNVCTINFAYLDGEVLCYPDMVKVGVSLYDGKVVSFDARNYIQNHTSRLLALPQISLEQARQMLSSRLSVLSCRQCIIPTNFGSEIFCWEFLCQSAQGQKVLTYINAKTGDEEQVFIVIEDENGIMTK